MGAFSEEQLGEIPLEVKADLDADLVGEFIHDAREQLEIIEHGTLVLEKNALDRETIHNLFRAFHTLKGNAGFLEFTAISQLAHALESLLDEARKEQFEINSISIEVILKSRDTFIRFLDQIEAQVSGKKPRQPINIPTAALKAATRFILTNQAKPQMPTPVVAPQPKPIIAAAPQPKAATAPLPKPAAALPNPATIPLPLPVHDDHDEAPTSSNGTVINAVKVATNKLDGLVDLAGELLIAQSLIAQSLATPDVSRHVLTRNLDQLNRISKELQRTAMSMRMVPIRSTFRKMNRLVRDISAEQGKSIRLELEGEDTEVDRTIVEKIADPLMHMVRNAIDHAIEPPEQRATAGKPETGTILLRAYHKSGNIIIEVTDDGAGLNRDRIREKAIKNGLLKSSVTPDDRDLLGLILRPGFSTAETVTAISGRGVGMDVVHKNISHLRGRIDIKSVAGKGTTFTIRLPLTLAIIDGLIIRVGNERYILPTIAVRESFHPRSCTITSLPGNVELVEMRKELIPLLRLREHFRLGDGAAPGAGIMIVIESDGEKRCLLADELVGKQEVVIKNLGEVFKTDPMVSGGAILGDGCVGLILDPAALVHLEHAPADLATAA